MKKLYVYKHNLLYISRPQINASQDKWLKTNEMS